MIDVKEHQLEMGALLDTFKKRVEDGEIRGLVVVAYGQTGCEFGSNTGSTPPLAIVGGLELAKNIALGNMTANLTMYKAPGSDQ